MAEPMTAQRKREIEGEKLQLVKADAHIEAGRGRLRDQQDLLRSLQSAGEESEYAERLLEAMKQTLIEWERHRELIEQRITYLEQDASLR
jgi:hypothetical protein